MVVLSLLTLPASLGISATSLLLPTIAADLGTSIGAATWLLTIYGWGMAVSMPLVAALVRRLGRGAALVAGVAAQALGAVLVLADTPLPVITAGRLALSAGAGTMLVLSVGIAREIAEPRLRQYTLGVITASLGVSGAAGPLAGSALADVASWRVALALPALSLVAAPAARRYATGGADTSTGRFDATGAGVFMLVVTALFVILQGPAGGVPTSLVVFGAAAGLAALAVLVPLVRARPDGFLPMSVRGDRRFVISSVFVLSTATINFALIYAVPQLLATHPHWERSEIGAVLVVPTLLGAALSWAMAAVTVRLGARRSVLILAGAAAAAAAVASIATTVPALLVGAAVGAFASAAAQGVLAAAATATVPGASRTQAIGLFNLAFQFGSVVGPATLASLAPIIGLGRALGALGLLPLVIIVVSRAGAVLRRQNETV
ncbi:MFS transporter [Actinophytocola sp. KF-1]